MSASHATDFNYFLVLLQQNNGFKLQLKEYLLLTSIKLLSRKDLSGRKIFTGRKKFLLVTRYSLLFTRYSLLVTVLLVTCYPLNRDDRGLLSSCKHPELYISFRYIFKCGCKCVNIQNIQILILSY